eukprot:1373457-Rhodomonas_salina.1
MTFWIISTEPDAQQPSVLQVKQQFLGSLEQLGTGLRHVSSQDVDMVHNLWLRPDHSVHRASHRGLIPRELLGITVLVK